MGQMSVAAVAAVGLRGTILYFTVSVDDSFHCVQAAGTDPECLRSVVDYYMGISNFP